MTVASLMRRTSETVVTSAARTETGQSAAISCHATSVVVVGIDVTAASGTTPTLDPTIEWSFDGSTWFQADPADAFTQITTTAKKVKRFNTKAPFYRIVWTIAGTTPSFTFSVTGYDDARDGLAR